MSTIPNGPFEALLDYLKRTRGFDFTAYKRSSLMRRVEKRMQAVGLEEFGAYLNLLDEQPEEFTALFNTILINVTSFFRDAEPWEHLKNEILPAIIGSREPNQPIRLWSAGCSSGQEAYTLAMVAAEVMGIDAARQHVKIYATDADEEALSEARQAVYSARQVESVPPELLEKYFEKNGQRYSFARELRRNIIFGRHDLVRDAPISRIDLLVCRNTLMYFNSDTQNRILARFHFSVNDGGHLFLGKSETLLTHADLFAATDLRHRLFSKVPRGNLRDRMRLMAEAGGDTTVPYMLLHTRLLAAAADVVSVAQIVMDTQGCIAHLNVPARLLFGLSSHDVGRPVQDLELSYRPVDLRSLIEQSQRERRPHTVSQVEFPTAGGDFRCLDIDVTPLFDANGNSLGTSIAFTNVTANRKLQIELLHTNQELETTLEELQSTNEELETTNEELQSTNEELETMNEELQSTNEELQTLNDESRQSSEELGEVNLFLQAILTSFRGSVIVLDREMGVLTWNRQAENLWGLRAEEVLGRHLLNLDIGLPVETLKTPIRSLLAGEIAQFETRLAVTNRRGKTIGCIVTLIPLHQVRNNESFIGGIISVIEEMQAEEIRGPNTRIHKNGHQEIANGELKSSQNANL